MSEEIRVRIILESCIFKDAYLNQGFLEREFGKRIILLRKPFAFYSDEYANEVLSNGEIERGELNSGNEFEDVNTKEHTDNGDNPGGSRHNYLNVSDLSPQDLLGQYVLVAYDKKPYPGIVTDCDETEVFVSCMHRIGNLDNPSFYWPLAVRDECWYDMENVLGTIPEPKLVGQKYIVDVSLWKQALEMIKM
ncbi:Hypothetical predicted protein [Mytilus galloprovincialis]|uniref:Uncharacterized protein n=1 Tax=Mytilus galloprovincialis TaxID=29158 RepID=A0A8B6E3P2_MYTGA|nr:Hypothetical predicted protein [Mytilus galloprovincialis]